MICSLMLDPDDSVDFAGNKGTALGRPLSAYPMKAARTSAHIQKHHVVSESPPVKAVAAQYGAIILDPPPAGAAGSLSPAEAQLLHGYARIRDELKGDKETLELLVVLLSNAPAVSTDLVDKGLEALHERQDVDSAVSVSPYNRWNPFHAKRETGGLLEPYAPYAPDSRGDVWYPDWGVMILRPRCMEEIKGPPPQAWLGRKVLPLKQWGGGPIDYQWQIPGLEYWLKKHGFTDKSASLEMQPKPQPQLAPKGDRR